MKDLIAKKVIEYYSNFETMHSDLTHTQEVVSYTRLIALGDGYSQEQVDFLESAAWLHDIGCPRSKEIYGNSAPRNQEDVGSKVCLELIADLENKELLAQIVGSHHRLSKARKLGFMPLYQADMIVNLLSGYYSLDILPQISRNVMTTKASKELISILF